jgi:hypothetical protein
MSSKIQPRIRSKRGDYHFFASSAEYLQKEIATVVGSMGDLRYTLTRECGVPGMLDAIGVVIGDTLRSISR